MLTKYQVLKIKRHSVEAVNSLPEDHPWIHYLGSVDALCETALALFNAASQQPNATDGDNNKPNPYLLDGDELARTEKAAKDGSRR